MRKRPGVLSAILLVAALGGPAFHWALAAAAQPTYQAKPLDWWLSWWSTNREGPWVSADGPPQRAADLSQCKPALSSIGPAAVPVITRRLREKKSSAWDSRQAAACFGDIGSNAIPQLLEAMDDESPSVRLAAALALEPYAGNLLSTNETAKVFGRGLEDKNDELIAVSLEALARIGAAASNSLPGVIKILKVSLADTNRTRDWNHSVRCNGAAVLAAIGPPAAQATPVLTNLLAVAGFVDDLSVAIALWRITHDTRSTLPVLLKYPDYLSAIDTFGEMGAVAKAAVPRLLEMSKTTDATYQQSVFRALKNIDPEAAARAGIR